MATRFQRVQWNPVLPIVLLAIETVLLVLAGPRPLRITAVVVTGVWSAIALYNWRTGGRFVRSLYD
jgi:hypothetical protein